MLLEEAAKEMALKNRGVPASFDYDARVSEMLDLLRSAPRIVQYKFISNAISTIPSTQVGICEICKYPFVYKTRHAKIICSPACHAYKAIHGNGEKHGIRTKKATEEVAK